MLMKLTEVRKNTEERINNVANADYDVSIYKVKSFENMNMAEVNVNIEIEAKT